MTDGDDCWSVNWAGTSPWLAAFSNQVAAWAGSCCTPWRASPASGTRLPRAAAAADRVVAIFIPQHDVAALVRGGVGVGEDQRVIDGPVDHPIDLSQFHIGPDGRG